MTEGQIEQALEILEKRLEEQGSLQLVKLAGGYQLCTKPEFAELISNFLKPQKQRLSKSLMEVLAIVAYKQPITGAEIDEVRGVQSDYSIRSLQERRLVREVGRKPVAGRPILYGTSDQFLHQFKLNDLSELPKLEGITSADALEAIQIGSLFDDPSSESGAESVPDSRAVVSTEAAPEPEIEPESEPEPEQIIEPAPEIEAESEPEPESEFPIES